MYRRVEDVKDGDVVTGMYWREGEAKNRLYRRVEDGMKILSLKGLKVE